jgi:hypothetical protein
MRKVEHEVAMEVIANELERHAQTLRGIQEADENLWSLIERALVVANRNEQNDLAKALAVILSARDMKAPGYECSVLDCAPGREMKPMAPKPPEFQPVVVECPFCGMMLHVGGPKPDWRCECANDAAVALMPIEIPSPAPGPTHHNERHEGAGPTASTGGGGVSEPDECTPTHPEDVPGEIEHPCYENPEYPENCDLFDGETREGWPTCLAKQKGLTWEKCSSGKLSPYHQEKTNPPAPPPVMLCNRAAQCLREGNGCGHATEHPYNTLEGCWDALFLMLTNRPERAAELMRGSPLPDHIWIGTSVEDQETADERIPHLGCTYPGQRCEPSPPPVAHSMPRTEE